VASLTRIIAFAFISALHIIVTFTERSMSKLYYDSRKPTNIKSVKPSSTTEGLTLREEREREREGERDSLSNVQLICSFMLSRVSFCTEVLHATEASRSHI